jgi:hypothetical protein
MPVLFGEYVNESMGELKTILLSRSVFTHYHLKRAHRTCLVYFPMFLCGSKKHRQEAWKIAVTGCRFQVKAFLSLAVPFCLLPSASCLFGHRGPRRNRGPQRNSQNSVSF